MTQPQTPSQPNSQTPSAWHADPRVRSLLVGNGIAAVVLAFVLGGIMQTPPAAAQPANVAAAGERARGEYTMVSGRFREGGSSAIYIIDSSNQEVVAVRWDTGKQQLTGIGYRSIANDARAGRGR